MPPIEVIASVEADGAREAAADIETVGDAIKRTSEQSQRSAPAHKQHSDAIGKIGTASLVAGGAMLAGFGMAAHGLADFDKEMSGVAAVAGATGDELEQLRGAAIKAGADTAFSAGEAAQAEAELAKAGVSVKDILGGGLAGALGLAAAGQIDVAQAATLSAEALKMFNLSGSQTGHVADLLAAGANKSAADVTDLGMALEQGGLVAKQTGLSIEDTVGVLSMFADKALKGSDAGTSLKTMLQRLTPTSQPAIDAMHQLGISAYDSTGKFIGLANFAQNLKDSLSDLTAEQRNTALTTIFGSDAVRAASILYEGGAASVNEYTKAVDDNGAASRMASTQLDNLSGDLEQLKGSLETALIQTGSGANDTLRGLTQTATGMVNAFTEAPTWLQQTTVGVLGIGGAGLAATGAIGTMIPKITAVKEAFTALESSSQMALGGIGVALTIGTALLANWARGKEQARQAEKEWADALTAGAGALRANNQLALESGPAYDKLKKDFEDVGTEMDAISLSIPLIAKGFTDVETAGKDLGAGFADIGTKAMMVVDKTAFMGDVGIKAITDLGHAVKVPDAALAELGTKLKTTDGPLQRFGLLVNTSGKLAQTWATQNGVADNSLVKLLISAKAAGADKTLIDKLIKEADAAAKSAEAQRILLGAQADVKTSTTDTARVFNDYDSQLSQVGVTHQDVIDAINNEDGARHELEMTLKSNGAASGDLHDRISALVASHDAGAQAGKKMKLELDDVESAMKGAGSAATATQGEFGSYGSQLTDLTGATDDVSDATKKAEDALNDYKDALDALLGKPMSLEKANEGWEQSIDDLTKSFTENKVTIDIHTEAGRNNRAAILDAAEAAKDQAQAYVDMTGDTAGATKMLLEHRDALIDEAVKLGLSRDKAKEYVEMLGLTPENISTGIGLSTQEATDQYNAWLAWAAQQSVTVKVYTHPDGSVTAGGHTTRARGGPLAAGQLSLVGEEGPELVRFDTDAMVYTAAETRSIMAGARDVSSGGALVGSAATGGAPVIYIDQVILHDVTDGPAMIRGLLDFVRVHGPIPNEIKQAMARV